MALLFVFLLTIAFAAMSGLTFWMDAQNAKAALDAMSPDQAGTLASLELSSQYKMKNKAYKKTIFVGILNCLSIGFLGYLYIQHKRGFSLSIDAPLGKNNPRG